MNDDTKTPLCKVVIAIHGIRTFGQWHDRLAELITGTNQKSIHFERYYYGYFSVISFWLPLLRWLAVRHFRRRFMNLVSQYPNAKFIIVAHSFGTHLAGWALRGIPPDRLPEVERIILAGSVLRSDFDWSPLFHSNRVGQVINDCGSGDFILALSQFGVPFTGMAGRIGFFGFEGSRLINRIFPGGHGHYFVSTKDDIAPFMRQHWLPLILGNQPEPAPPRPVPTWLKGIYYTILQVADPVKLLVYGAIAFGIVYIAYIKPRTEAQIATYSRNFESASSLLAADLNLPQATAMLGSLAESRAVNAPATLPDPENLLRYAIPRLRPLSVALNALPTPGMFLWRGRTYLKRDAGIFEVSVVQPLGFSAVEGVDLFLVLVRRELSAHAYVVDAKGQVRWDFGFRRNKIGFNSIELRRYIHNSGIIFIKFDSNSDTGTEVLILAADIIAKRAAIIRSQDRGTFDGTLEIRSNAACNEVSLPPPENIDPRGPAQDPNAKTLYIDVHALPRLGDKDQTVRDAPERKKEAARSQLNQNFWTTCTKPLAVAKIEQLDFPQVLPESAMWSPMLPSIGQKPTQRCEGDSLTPQEVVRLDFTQVRNLAPGNSDGLREEFGRECLALRTGPEGQKFIVKKRTAGPAYRAWLVCRIEALVVTTCRDFEFGNSGGGFWHPHGSRYLIIENGSDEERIWWYLFDLTKFDQVDAKDVLPDQSRAEQFSAVQIDERAGQIVTLSRIQGSTAYRVSLYRLDRALKFFASRVLEPLPEMRKEFGSPATLYEKSDRVVVFLPPQSLFGLSFSPASIDLQWSLLTMGFETGRAVTVTNSHSGSFFAVHSRDALRLVDGRDGKFATALLMTDSIDSCIRGIKSLVFESDEGVVLNGEGCNKRRGALQPRSSLASSTDLVADRLGTSPQTYAAERPLLIGAQAARQPNSWWPF